MNDLRSRWASDPIFAEMLKRMLDPSLDPPTDATREWWHRAPKVKHYVFDNDAFDFRCVPLDGKALGEVWLAHCCLDEAAARNCLFDRTYFQDATARGCDFTGSRFIVPQMSRFFARGAIFRRCVFEGGFLHGHHSRTLKDARGNLIKGGYSDLRECDFTDARVSEVALDDCDFRGATISGAQFIDCNFRLSDLRGVELTSARFERCEFTESEFDDSPHTRTLLKQGDNIGLERIVWHPSGV